MNFRYTLGAIASIPLLPILYFQGKNIIKSIPKLPEAKEPEGLVDRHSDKRFNLLCLGESTIAGVGVQQHKNGFSGILAESLAQGLDANVQWRVIARSGYTAKQVNERLVPKIPKQKFDFIVIGLGGNDAFTLNRPWIWRQHIRLLLANIRKAQPNAHNSLMGGILAKKICALG